MFPREHLLSQSRECGPNSCQTSELRLKIDWRVWLEGLDYYIDRETGVDLKSSSR